MKLTLFSKDRINDFFLPNQISGSYSFDEDPNEESKIINVKSVNDKWILIKTDNITIVSEGEIVDEIELIPKTFYSLKKEDKSYLLYVTSSIEPDYEIYSFSTDINMIIGNTPDCNINYNCPFINSIVATIVADNNYLKLTRENDSILYLNNEMMTLKEVIILPGYTLDIFGLRIIFLSNMLIINNPYKGISITNDSSRIYKYSCEVEKYENIEVKDIDLYDKKDYFSKSPRIRRNIEEKDLKIDAPPKAKNAEKLPLLLTIGPMLSMGLTSSMTMINAFNQITSGATTYAKSWPTLLSSSSMLLTSLLWPFLTKAYNKHQERDERNKIVLAYQKYLNGKEEELQKETVLQKVILEENLITALDCLNIINTKKNNFWCKRTDQNDFLTARIGIGKIPLKVNVEWPEEGFSIEEDELKDLAEKIIEKNKYIDNCPYEYSFYENFLTAIMGVEKKCYGFINNILLQFMTFYCYDELKIIVFTNEQNEHKWEYLKYSNYCFNNDKTVRYFASNIEEARNLSSYLSQELYFKLETTGKTDLPAQKPYYLIISDDYSSYKKIDFLATVTDLDKNVGYSTILIDNSLDKLPSKCFNFINLNEGSSGVLKNSYEEAEINDFHDEINYDINMKVVTKILSNIPIEIEGVSNGLPEAIDFLEMEHVGNVEQLNILNRWNNNDSTQSLKAEVGVDEEGNLMYLDLHEKYHGPHGLIAGMTGSGKSEFIISYILSMAMNYSPDDIAFILIDYKGGGLAFAFENKVTGVKLPHLAGTITNLDKAEMNRTLVSIDSEVKRRQAQFNEARDLLGESTIDIYKYQSFYHDGKLKEPIPHLFIISDEFAELKSQQPEFMDNLISVARIGRSLGVHLILATQKPSGVVNDQIWSNTKFRVCLKVQDESDSKEMLKKPDAASLKQSGRFYLQVGFDEYYALGQSGWAGAKYYPADKVQVQVDKSINFINNCGQVIKTIKEENNNSKKEAQGEQLAAVMNEIINVSKQTNKEARRLWLDNIPNIILTDNIESKYNINHTPYNIIATIGEYDAPELQEQGIVTYNILEDGNTVIYGTDGTEREQMLNTIIYSVCKNHTSEEVNFYVVDYGSEQLRMFANLPQIGGIVFAEENEKYTNLIKLINNETFTRKKLFADYGGEYKNYIKNSGKKLPLKVIIFNNYDSIKEAIPNSYDQMPELLRDSERYGIIYILTANGKNAIHTKLAQNINNNYALKLKDHFEYSDILNGKTKQTPQDMPGRGMLNNGNIHEFQTASLVEDEATLSDFVIKFIEEVKKMNKTKAANIPTLPKHVRIEDVESYITNIKSVPVGILKNSLEVLTIDFQANIGNIICSNKIENTKNYIKSLIKVFRIMKMGIVLIDAQNGLEEEKNNVSNYFKSDFDKTIEQLDKYIEKTAPNVNFDIAIIIYGLDKFKNKLTDIKVFEEFLTKIKQYEKIPVIIVETANKMKELLFDSWYKTIFPNEGLWIGTGAGDQTVLRISEYNKENNLEYKNDIGFYISNGSAQIIKLLDFEAKDDVDE